MKSLRTQLWIWLFGLLASIGLILASSYYLTVQDEVNEFFDVKLRQIAMIIGDIRHDQFKLAPSGAIDDANDDVVIQVWSAGGVELSRPQTSARILRGTSAGYWNTSNESGRWRSYTLVLAEQTVQVSQAVTDREELAADAALRALMPLAVIIPLSWLALGIIIGRVFKQLDRLAKMIARRTPVEMDPIECANVPSEVVPLIDAMNELISRLQGAVAIQEQFMADAAHELRTPLTALQLQVENLRKVMTNADAGPRIDALERGIRRASALTRQLLRLAYHADQKLHQLAPTDLVALTTESIAEILPLADQMQHDLGFVRSDPAIVKGDPDALRVLVGNLLENAIRHTPQGGVINVTIRSCEKCAILEICDTGPGIAADQLNLVLQPFHRVAGAEIEGSGLGLSIATRIVAQHLALMSLANREDRSGLLVRVVFPKSDFDSK